MMHSSVHRITGRPRCRDATDDKILALVPVCQADALVSSDDDLLVLNPWRGARPAEFLALQGLPR